MVHGVGESFLDSSNLDLVAQKPKHVIHTAALVACQWYSFEMHAAARRVAKKVLGMRPPNERPHTPHRELPNTSQRARPLIRAADAGGPDTRIGGELGGAR